MVVLLLLLFRKIELAKTDFWSDVTIWSLDLFGAPCSMLMGSQE
jgi:hypothetical protein